MTLASTGSPLAAPSSKKAPKSLRGFPLKFNLRKGFGVILQQFRVGQEDAQDHRFAGAFDGPAHEQGALGQQRD